MPLAIAPMSARLRRSPWALALAVSLLVTCWIVGNPRSSGPDEPSHMVYSAAVVRGEFDGAPDPVSPSSELYVLPGMVGTPDPGCWAQLPDVGVGCANLQPISTEQALRSTTSSNYAPWALLLPGLASFSPSANAYVYLARLFNAILPVLLVSASLLLLVRDRSVSASAAFLGATPIVWFTLGIVNPSALAISGGLALWAGLLVRRSSAAAFVTVCGWAAVLLARRDGPLWASAIVLTCCALIGIRPRDLWTLLGRRGRWVALALIPLPLLPSIQRGDVGFNLLLAGSTISIVIADQAVAWWQRHPTRSDRIGFTMCAVLAAAATSVTLVVMRPGGLQTETIRLIVTNTGDHLQQLVGVLGWLDAPVPTTGVYLFWATIGGLAAVAVLEYQRAAVVFASALAFAVFAAWMLELGQGATYGRYWQGRYTMPFAIGLPIVLAWRPRADGLVDRLNVYVAVAGWIVLNLGFFAAQRRWGIGINGSWYPWDWDTWGSPIPPLALVLAHAVITAAIVVFIIAAPAVQTVAETDE
jgi:hypothetical protein